MSSQNHTSWHVVSRKGQSSDHCCSRFIWPLLPQYLNFMAWLTIYTPTTLNFSENSASATTFHLRLPSGKWKAVSSVSVSGWKPTCLKVNDDKTEILIIRPKSAHQHHIPESVRIGNTNVTPNTHAINLGVTFDCNMSLERHVTNISRTAHYHLHMEYGRNAPLPECPSRNAPTA